MKYLTILASFLAAAQGLTFNCKFENKGFHILGNVYTCNNAQVIASNNLTTLETVQGTHLSGRNNAAVKVVDCYQDLTMKQLPLNMDKFFPNLSLIRWWHGSLTSISAEDFRLLPHLEYLSIHDNKIISLDGDLFKFLPKLRAINFMGNLFTNVGENLLSSSNAWVYVNFQRNPCINTLAQNAPEINNLRQQLLTQCPPLVITTTQAPTTTTTRTSTISTTTENICHVRCTMNEEVDEVVKELKYQREINEELRETLRRQNDNNDDRIRELEKRMREILSIP